MKPSKLFFKAIDTILTVALIKALLLILFPSCKDTTWAAVILYWLLYVEFKIEVVKSEGASK